MGDWESNYSYRPDPLFEEIFQCLSFSKYKYPHLETGNKIIMPSSALTRIHNARLKFPLIFEMEGFRSDKKSHCGVLEFEAEEGFIHMPDWMMKNLDLREGAHVTLRSSSLSRGTYMKLQPHTASFIELSDPKAVLETALRGFSCLSSGDTFLIRYCDRDFYIDVVRVGPGDAISLIDTDCEVDFALPLDYKEPERPEIVKKVVEKGKDENEKVEFRPFMGSGRRMDGVVVGGGCNADAVTVMEEREKGVAVGNGRTVVEERKKLGVVFGGGRAVSSVAEERKKDGGRAVSSVAEERKKDGGEDDRKDEFKPFTGRSRLLRER